jgi:hypothetical protein
MYPLSARFFVQSLQSKGFSAVLLWQGLCFEMFSCKLLISNEKERCLVYFEATLIVAGWRGETCHGYVVDGVGFRWFWGSTCDFWAEFEEKICGIAVLS